ncbi:hypothetical protein [Methylobacterium dankookense]|jgi:hypothetical protein|uniref:DUF2946 domain-containing protein n=1 Tax=Methylobacterium dankookense TaxID=560405 RepID=A0A564G3T2_9HYPH|nr:hypothetical protein [Methylobacterium dankookense]GJD56474.1 hypothetical protein IFDJLNFL_2371 [Methylobacterium dankookense]VUF14752.1 hypothetical protein MTDSW087_04477 [Methylobacterium dankookense]
MGSRHGHSRRRAARGWWAVAARLLALVLALSLVAPVAGYADDLAFHESHGHAAELTVVDAAPAPGTGDPGLACHIHCGCHQVAPTAASGPVMPCLEAAPPVYARLSEMASSIAPDRLPRPPRA